MQLEIILLNAAQASMDAHALDYERMSRSFKALLLDLWSLAVLINKLSWFTSVGQMVYEPVLKPFPGRMSECWKW